MRIQMLSAGDEALALPLLEAQYREHGIDVNGRPLRSALSRLLRSPGSGAVLLALFPAPVGVAAISFTFSLERCGPVCWLDELYVEKRLRGRGIGRALLVRACAAARRQGCVQMELEIVRGHERAARLYRREGFAALPRKRYSKPLRRAR